MLEQDQKIEITSMEAKKLQRKFYAFKDAWQARADKLGSQGRVELAAQARINAAALMRYQVIIEEGKAIFIHKDFLSEQLGERIIASGQKVTDSLFDAARLHAKQSEGASLESELGGPLPRAASQTTEHTPAIQKLLGLGEFASDAPPKGEDVCEPLTEEEKELIRKLEGGYTEDDELSGGNEP